MSDEVPVASEPAPPPAPDFVEIPIPPPTVVDVAAIVSVAVAQAIASLPPITFETYDAAGQLVSSKSYPQSAGGAVVKLKVG